MCPELAHTELGLDSRCVWLEPILLIVQNTAAALRYWTTVCWVTTICKTTVQDIWPCSPSDKCCPSLPGSFQFNILTYQRRIFSFQSMKQRCIQFHHSQHVKKYPKCHSTESSTMLQMPLQSLSSHLWQRR